MAEEQVDHVGLVGGVEAERLTVAQVGVGDRARRARAERGVLLEQAILLERLEVEIRPGVLDLDTHTGTTEPGDVGDVGTTRLETGEVAVARQGAGLAELHELELRRLASDLRGRGGVGTDGAGGQRGHRDHLSILRFQVLCRPTEGQHPVMQNVT